MDADDGPGQENSWFCPSCEEVHGPRITSSDCPICGQALTQMEEIQPDGKALPSPSLPLLLPGLGDDQQLQRALDLSFDAPQHNKPTDRNFRAQLVPRKFTENHFVRCEVHLEKERTSLVGTLAEFGAPLITRHVEEKKERTVCHAEGKIILCDPITLEADCIASLSGAIAFCQRGKVSFVDKARRAQEQGAVALIVGQTEAVWPYFMKDSTKSGNDIKIPCIMLSQKNSARLKSLLQSLSGEAQTTSGRINTCPSTPACPVCLEDFEMAEMYVRIPCEHIFHQGCLRPWLEKNNRCPVCRHELPSHSSQKPQTRDDTSAFIG